MARELLSRLRRYRRPAAAAALGVAAMLAASRLIPVNDTAVVVTAAAVSSGTALSARDVRIAHYPKSLVPAGSLTDAGDAVGALPLCSLTKGTPLTAAVLRDTGSVPTSPSHVAFPIRVADSAAAAVLRPGDHIMVFRRSPEGGSATVAASDVVVLGISAADGDDSATGQSGSALITVDVAKSTARRLAGAESAYVFALLGG